MLIKLVKKSLAALRAIPWTLKDGVLTWLSRRAAQIAVAGALLTGGLLLLVLAVLALPLIVAVLFVFAITFVLTKLVALWRGIESLFGKKHDTNPFEVERPAHFPTYESKPPDTGLHNRIFGPYNPDGFYDGVFEGGGVKAIAQIGAIRRMEDLRMRPQRLVGTSGGAIAAAGIAVGGTSNDLWRILAQTDLTGLFDARYLPNTKSWRLPFYGITPLLLPFVSKWGLMKGDAFLDLMRSALADIHETPAGTPITFGRLNADWHATLPASLSDLKSKNRLTIVATDVTRRQPIILPDGIEEYCIQQASEKPRGKKNQLCDTCASGGACATKDNLEVAVAVRMSMSMPFLFEPYRIRLKVRNPDGNIVDGGECAIADGGISSNFPMWILDAGPGLPPRYPTFGFLLQENIHVDGRVKDASVKELRNVLQLTTAIVRAGMGVIDRVQSEHAAARTISMATLDVKTEQFELTDEQRAKLLVAGVLAADRFFIAGEPPVAPATEGRPPFNWANYVRQFRGGIARPVVFPEGSPTTVEDVQYEVERAAILTR